MWNITECAVQSPHWLGQDRAVVHRLSKECTLVAVMDGHGETSDTVNTCAAYLPTLSRGPTHPNEGPAFLSLLYEKLNKKTWWRMDGCTFTAALLFHTGEVVCATLGDSFWVMNSDKRSVLRGPSHNANVNTVERAYAVSKGAFYGYPYILVGHVGLQLTRAFGDNHFHEVLRRTPEMQSFSRRKSGDWLALMTDGVHDELSDLADPEYEALIEALYNGASAATLVTEHGLTKRDDKAAIVCRFV